MIFYLCSYSEEGRKTYRPKRCGSNNKDEDNSPKPLNDKNHQASSQKLRQLICIGVGEDVIMSSLNDLRQPSFYSNSEIIRFF